MNRVIERVWSRFSRVYERLRAFPIDVWIERVLRQLYFAKKPNVTLPQLREFAARSFGPYGGYAQQYLFHHARNRPQIIGRITT